MAQIATDEYLAKRLVEVRESLEPEAPKAHRYGSDQVTIDWKGNELVVVGSWDAGELTDCDVFLKTDCAHNFGVYTEPQKMLADVTTLFGKELDEIVAKAEKQMLEDWRKETAYERGAARAEVFGAD